MVDSKSVLLMKMLKDKWVKVESTNKSIPDFEYRIYFAEKSDNKEHEDLYWVKTYIRFPKKSLFDRIMFYIKHKPSRLFVDVILEISGYQYNKNVTKILGIREIHIVDAKFRIF
jgi:hypothetical protein